MQCPSCGGQNFDGAEFCSLCLRSFAGLNAPAGSAPAADEHAAALEEGHAAGRAPWEVNPAAIHETPAMTVDHELARAAEASPGGGLPVNVVPRPQRETPIPGVSRPASVVIRYLLAGLLLVIGIGVWVLFIR